MLSALLALNAWTGGEFNRLELHGSALRLSEIGLLLTAITAVRRLGVRRSADLLMRRATPIWLGLLIAAAAIAMVRGLADHGLSAVVYDIQLFDFILTIPVVVLITDSPARTMWLLRAIIAISIVATVLFTASEALARASGSISLLADQEGEIGAGAMYASVSAAWSFAQLARAPRPSWMVTGIGFTALLLVALSDKRTAWIALAAALLAILLLSPGRRLIMTAGLGVVSAMGLIAAFVIGDVAGKTRTEAGAPMAAERPVFGPLEGDFERSSEGWKSFGTAASSEFATTTNWSDTGRYSLRLSVEATANGQAGYLFARDCCAGGGGIAVRPGQRYRASAVIRVDEAPPDGVSLQAIYYPDGGTYDRVAEANSDLAVHAGEERTLTLTTVAPPTSQIIGLQIGPSTLDEGDVASFNIDHVVLRESEEPYGPNLGSSSIGADVPVGNAAIENGSGSELDREFEGFLGGDTQEGENVEWRLAYWQELIKRQAEQPWQFLAGAGFGPTNFEHNGIRYDLRSSSDPAADDTTGPHNAFVGVLYLIGIVGLIGFIGILVAAVRRLTRALRAEAHLGEPRSYLLALSGVLVVAVLYMSLTEALRAPDLALFIWTAVGLMLGSSGVASGPGSSPSGER